MNTTNMFYFLQVWSASQKRLPSAIRWGNDPTENAFWDHIQEPLRNVRRWGKYLNMDGNLRPQDNLQHTHAFLLFLDFMFTVIGTKRHQGALPVPDILGLAVAVHDVGEGELKRDILYVDKSDKSDLDEYLAFEKLLVLLPEEKRMRFRQAFLLQFAQRNPSNFPAEARSIMARLASRRPTNENALAFEAGERIDYILYAMEQHITTGNTTILTHVLRNQLSHIRRIAESWSALKFIWTPTMDTWAEAVIVLNKKLEEERKAS